MPFPSRKEEGGEGQGGKEGKQQAQAQNEAEKKRSRRMFGNLLGHLQKAKKQEEVIQASDKMVARAEMVAKAEQAVAESGNRLKEQVRQERIEGRRRELEAIRSIRLKTSLAIHNLALARAETQKKSLSSGGYILTESSPKIFWRPKLMDGALEKLGKKTADVLGGELVVLRKRIEAEREEDVAAEEQRQRELEERIAAAREMAEARRKALEEGRGVDGGDVGGDEDAEAAAVEKEIQDEGDDDGETDDGPADETLGV